MSQATPFSSRFPDDWTESPEIDDDGESIPSRPSSPLQQVEASEDAAPPPVTSATSKYATHFPSSWALQSTSPQGSGVLRDTKSINSVAYRTINGRSLTGLPLEAHALSQRSMKTQSFYIPNETDHRRDEFRETLLALLESSRSQTEARWGGQGGHILSRPGNHPPRESPNITPTKRPVEVVVRTAKATVEDVDDEEDDYSLYGPSGDGDVPHRAPSVAYAYSTRTSSSVMN